MATRIRIKSFEGTHVHFDTHINNYTLCGLETGGDISLGIYEAVETNQKVNCIDCIRVVKFCHSINTNEFKDL